MRTVGRKLKRISLHIFEDDYLFLRKRFGWGYTEAIRDTLHKEVQKHREKESYKEQQYE